MRPPPMLLLRAFGFRQAGKCYLSHFFPNGLTEHLQRSGGGNLDMAGHRKTKTS